MFGDIRCSDKNSPWLEGARFNMIQKIRVLVNVKIIQRHSNCDADKKCRSGISDTRVLQDVELLERDHDLAAKVIGDHDLLKLVCVLIDEDLRTDVARSVAKRCHVLVAPGCAHLQPPGIYQSTYNIDLLLRMSILKAAVINCGYKIFDCLR